MSALDDLINGQQNQGTAPTGTSALDALISKNASTAYKKPSPAAPEPPLFQKQDASFGNEYAGFKPGAGGGTPFDFHVVTPKFSVKETPWYGNFDIVPNAGHIAEAGKKTFNVVSQVAEGAMNNMNDLFDFGATFIPKVAQGKATKQDVIKGAAATLKFGAGIAGVAFSAISSELTAAESLGLPIISQVAAVSNRLFEKLGEGGSYLAGKAIDVLPVSDATKSILKGPSQELGAIALPLLFAKTTGPLLGKVGEMRKITEKTVPTPEGGTMTMLGSEPTIPAKIANAIDKVQTFSFAPLTETAKLISNKITEKINARKAAGENVDSPDVARKIVNEAVKETPAEIPAEMKIKKTDAEGNVSAEEPLKVYTNQKLVLQNFIKGQEDINYKVVPSIGRDPSGNQITARFEWDYKRQQATMYVTKSSTAEDLAHEMGHFLDRKLSTEVGSRLSDVIPDYASNKDQYNSTLAAYAIDRLGGDAPKKKIDSTIKTLVAGFDSQIRTLSATETRGFNDKFAEAVKEVLIRPDIAAKKAPEFTSFIKYALSKEGPFTKPIKDIASRNPETAKAMEKVVEVKSTEKPGKAVEVKSSEKITKTPKSEQSSQAEKPAEIPKPSKFKGEGITSPAFNEAKINAPEDVIKILNDVAEKNDQFSKDRRVATLEEMRQFSYQFLGDENLYESLPSAIRKNIGMLKAAEQTVADLSSELASDFKNADLSKITSTERKNLLEKQAKLEKVFRAFAGGRTEASHLLNSLRSEVVPGENNIMLAITNSGKKLSLEESKNIFEKLDRVKETASGAGDFSDVLGKQNQLLDYFKARKDLEDYIDSMIPTHALKVATSLIGRGMMLASLKSPITNMIGNTTQGIMQVAERRLSGGAFSGMNGEYAKDYMKFVNKVYAETGYDLTRMESFSTEQKVLGETRVHAQGPGIVRKVGRFFDDWVFKKTQGAPDVAFSSFHFIDSVNLATTKIAVQEGLKGSTAKSHALEIMKDAMSPNPKTEDGMAVRKQAVADAMYATYQNNSHASKISLGIRRLFNIASGDLRLGDLNIPFAKTPANVVGAGTESSGGGIVSGIINMRDAIAKAKIGDEVGKKQAIQKAVRGFVRAGIGISVGILISSLLKEDDFIGTYPTNAKERNTMQQLGGTENMIRIGDKWVSLEYFGPIGPVVAGFMYAKKYGTNWPDRLYRYLQGVGTQLLRLPGINEIRKSADYIQESVSIDKSTADVVLDAKNSLLNFLRARTVPGIVSDISKMTNYAERETNLSPLGKVGANIPFISNTMNERVDVLGDIIKTEPGISQLLFGSRVKSVKEDPVRLFLFQNDLSISVPSKSTEITIGREKRQMTPDEYYNYIKESGPLIKAEIERRQSMIARQRTQDDKQKAVNDIVTNVRQKIKSQIEREARRNQ